MLLNDQWYQQVYDVLLEVQYQTAGQNIEPLDIVDPYFGQQPFDETAVLDWGTLHLAPKVLTRLRAYLDAWSEQRTIQRQPQASLAALYWVYRPNGKTLTYSDVIMLIKAQQLQQRAQK